MSWSNLFMKINFNHFKANHQSSFTEHTTNLAANEQYCTPESSNEPLLSFLKHDHVITECIITQ